MEAAQQQPRTIDVTGLPEEAIRIIESLVSLLRGRQPEGEVSSGLASYQEWSRAFREWVDSHPRLGTPGDDSRESIYAGRGE